MRIEGLTSLAHAIAHTETNSIVFDEILYLKEENSDPVHYYFMNGKFEVAYYTPLKDVMIVHDVPKEWTDQDMAECTIL